MDGQLDKEVKRLNELRRIRLEDPGKLSDDVECKMS